MAVTTANRVIISSTNGDTFSGPQKITAIKLMGGSGASTASITNGNSVVIWQDGCAASVSTNTYFEECWQLSNDTYTIGLTGTGAKLYIYLA